MPDRTVPLAGAVFCTVPLSTSVFVTVYVAVHVICPPTAKLVIGPDTAPSVPLPVNTRSSTVTFVNAFTPVFCTRNEYVTTWPAVVVDVGFTDFVNVNGCVYK